MKNAPTANEPLAYEVFSGIKHKKDLFNKVENLKDFNLRSIDYFYVVEVWKGDVCAFRDYAVHQMEIGFDKLENDVAERVFSSIFCVAIEATIEIGKRLKKDEA